MSASNSTQLGLPRVHHLWCIPTSRNFSDLSLSARCLRSNRGGGGGNEGPITPPHVSSGILPLWPAEVRRRPSFLSLFFICFLSPLWSVYDKRKKVYGSLMQDVGTRSASCPGLGERSWAQDERVVYWQIECWSSRSTSSVSGTCGKREESCSDQTCILWVLNVQEVTTCVKYGNFFTSRYYTKVIVYMLETNVSSPLLFCFPLFAFHIDPLMLSWPWWRFVLLFWGFRYQHESFRHLRG